MVVPLEDTMHERKLHIRYYKKDCGGQKYINIRRNIAVHAMPVKGPRDHCEGMTFH